MRRATLFRQPSRRRPGRCRAVFRGRSAWIKRSTRSRGWGPWCGNGSQRSACAPSATCSSTPRAGTRRPSPSGLSPTSSPRRRSRSRGRCGACRCDGRGRLTLVRAVVDDGSRQVTAVWFNQTWLVEKLGPGLTSACAGTLRRDEFSVRTYDVRARWRRPTCARCTPRARRYAVSSCARSSRLALPHAATSPIRCPPRSRARRLPLRATRSTRSTGRGRSTRRNAPAAGSPSTSCSSSRSASRAGGASASETSHRRSAARASSPTLPRGAALHAHADQERAIARDRRRPARPVPMQRLLQGDVGSGKTVVALYALLRAVEAGRQGR